MNKIGRKLILLLICSALVLTVFPLSVFADDLDPTYTWDDNLVGHKKSAVWKDGEWNVAEVTINIKNPQNIITQPVKSQIILVVDTSSSMTSARMSELKAAASAFVSNIYAIDGIENFVQMAIVSYSTNVTIRTSSGTGNLTNSSSALQNAINGLPNTGSGSTNIQGGLAAAQEIIESGEFTADNSYIVLMSDGHPSASYKVTSADITVPAGCEGTHDSDNSAVVPEASQESVTGLTFDRTSIVGQGNDYNLTAAMQLQIPCASGAAHYTAFPANHGVPAKYEAVQIKNTGTIIYTIGFEVGSGTPAEDVMLSLASPGCGFTAGTDGLTQIYSEISKTIREEIYASPAFVCDPLGFDTGGLIYNYDLIIDAGHPLSVTRPDENGNSVSSVINNSADLGPLFSYDSSSRTLYWDLIDRSDPDEWRFLYGDYQVKFYVKLANKDLPAAQNSDILNVPPNKGAYLSYTLNDENYKNNIADPLLQTQFTSTEIKGSKIVDVNGELRAPSALEDFRFTIKPDSSIEALNGTSFEIEAYNDPADTGTSGTDASGIYGFLIKFRDPGTYTFYIEEIDGGSPSTDYDSHQYTVTYVIDFEQNEQKTLQRLISGGTREDGSKDFTNIMLPAEIDLFARKTILNGNLLSDNNRIFTFELLDENRNVLQSVKNDLSGLVTFDTLKLYPVTDVSGSGNYSYTFYITEKIDSPKKNGITYDTNEYKLTVGTAVNPVTKELYISSLSITNKNGEQLLDMSVSAEGDHEAFISIITGEMKESCEFINSYDPSIPQTGDSSGTALWMILALASLGCAVSVYMISDLKNIKKAAGR